MALANDFRAYDSSFSGRIRGLLSNIKERRSRVAAYNKTVNELNSFSNRELTDIGIHRTDIAEIARRHAFEG
ncbi:DUF1127 domain-containing protein [Pseudoruegeria sp. SK021]|uniref:DUF1127 domain-containing protein n=1 Tax=Pseudoruegeria sp. SK021 TaxID=1933035 RepID=UPI000A245154|nr:DUF1127 domain-containing protein [Pseudoruegeria sp. SK021]OSP54931.1 hypothetical protein BV911_09785 [Pseudoruegeria sp. SK021]